MALLLLVWDRPLDVGHDAVLDADEDGDPDFVTTRGRRRSLVGTRTSSPSALMTRVEPC